MTKQVNVNIRKIRELAGMTREYVAAELNMTPSGFGKIERGEVDLTISKLLAIAQVLKVPPSSILYFDISILFENQIQK